MNNVQLKLTAMLTVVLIATPAWAQSSDQQWSTRDRTINGPRELQAPQLNEGQPELKNVTREALRTAAIDLLIQAADSRNPLLRANAIEALQYAPHYAEDAVRRGLVDENRGVRFVAAMMIGKLKMKRMADLLVPMLIDESDSVKAAAMYGLARCDRRVDLTPLATMLQSSDPEVRSNAALVLGELGNASAIPVLRAAAGKPMTRANPIRARIVDLQLAEALVKLGDDEELEVIRAALFSPPEMGELTALAALICGKLNDQAATGNLIDLATRTGDRQEPAEVRMAAAMALAQMAPNKAPIHVPLEYVTADRFEHRAQAAVVLGEFQRQEATETLTHLLSDRNPMVQVAAAGGLLQSTFE